MQQVAIAGAGLLGRVMAIRLLALGLKPHLFDAGTSDGGTSCAYAAAGILAPYSELEQADEIIFRLGRHATALWKEILEQIAGSNVFFQSQGTIAVAHAQDQSLLDEFGQRVRYKLLRANRILETESTTDWPEISAKMSSAKCVAVEDSTESVAVGDSAELAAFEGTSNDFRLGGAAVQVAGRAALQQLEPVLASRFDKAVFLPFEGQIDNRQLMNSLREYLLRMSVPWHENTAVQVSAHEIRTAAGSSRFDLVIDCRGMGAASDIAALRSVRGEMLDLVAPAVKISRPVRLMHPRYPIYMVPRENHHCLVGATSLESNDQRNITVHSALELLSAAYSLADAFANAEIVAARVNRRPALIDGQPRVFTSRGLLRINGLYRHGFLIAPRLSQIVCDFMLSNQVDPLYANLFKEETNRACLA
jgi:glycine oxidase